MRKYPFIGENTRLFCSKRSLFPNMAPKSGPECQKRPGAEKLQNSTFSLFSLKRVKERLFFDFSLFLSVRKWLANLGMTTFHGF